MTEYEHTVWISWLVPTKGSKCTTSESEKSSDCKGLPTGYLCTLPPLKAPFRRLRTGEMAFYKMDKPSWRVDVCVAL